jgi:hypothetical protein
VNDRGPGVADDVARAEPAAGSRALDELRKTLDRAQHLLREIEADDLLAPTPTPPPAPAPAPAPAPPPATAAPAAPSALANRLADLERELEAAEADRAELATRLVDAERQAGQLMNLYVATYQLHSTLDPSEVQATIAEIAVDLLGAERFALLLRHSDAPGCEVALAKGVATDSGLFARGRYDGGDPMIDATLADGVLRLGPTGGSATIAVVPLTVQEAHVGVLVLLKLFDHKPSLRADDRDILDLLAAHAASALFAARVYAQTDRKMRTLESLVKLVSGT